MGFLGFRLRVGQVGLCLFSFRPGLGHAGVGLLQLGGGLVDGALEVGVFLAEAGEVAFQLGQELGLLRGGHGGEGFLELGFQQDNFVVTRLNGALEDGDLAAGGGGVKRSRLGRGFSCLPRHLGTDRLQFLVDVLDAEIHDGGVPVRIAGLEGGQVVLGLAVFLNGGVFLSKPGKVVRLGDEGVSLNEGDVRPRSVGCGQEAKRQEKRGDE